MQIEILDLSMTDLTLRQNYLSSLPSSIGKLVNLQVLKVDENKLTELTDMIGECRQLSELGKLSMSVRWWVINYD